MIHEKAEEQLSYWIYGVKTTFISIFCSDCNFDLRKENKKPQHPEKLLMKNCKKNKKTPSKQTNEKKEMYTEKGNF